MAGKNEGGDKVKRVKVCLVGEQPVPNMLPIRHYRPNQVILVGSEKTKPVSEKLRKVLENEMNVSILPVDPYNIVDIKERLKEQLSNITYQAEIIVNVTGGTKIMSYAAIQVAQEFESKIVYLQSEKSQSKLYQYQFENSELLLLGTEIIEEALTIDEYLRIHIGSYGKRKRDENLFEQNVLEALRPYVSEIEPNVSFGTNTELDLVIRFENQVGVAEVTTGNPNKTKIDQLHSATRRETLGVYTKRFLIATRKLEQNNRILAEASDISVIELVSCSNDELSDEDREKLVKKVKSKFK